MSAVITSLTVQKLKIKLLGWKHTVVEFNVLPWNISKVQGFVCLFVCFPGVTTHCGCIFTDK
jgi:hypothetical protein